MDSLLDRFIRGEFVIFFDPAQLMPKIVEGERFDEAVEGAAALGFVGHFNQRMSRKQNDGGTDGLRDEVGKEKETVFTIQIQVEKYGIKFLLLEESGGVSGGASGG